MKSRRLILILIFVALQITAAFAPYVPYIKGAFPTNPNLKDLLDWGITSFGILFGVLTAFLGLSFFLQSKDEEERHATLLAAIDAPEIRLLSDHEFYVEFLAGMRKAKIQVNITYLAVHPPNDTKRQERIRYYQDVMR